MEIFECIKKRRSVRLYIDKEVDKEIVLRLINSAMQAPSACNRQAWKFIWVKQMETKRILEKQGSPIITKSPCGILVLYRNDEKILLYALDKLLSEKVDIRNY